MACFSIVQCRQFNSLQIEKMDTYFFMLDGSDSNCSPTWHGIEWESHFRGNLPTTIVDHINGKGNQSKSNMLLLNLQHLPTMH